LALYFVHGLIPRLIAFIPGFTGFIPRFTDFTEGNTSFTVSSSENIILAVFQRSDSSTGVSNWTCSVGHTRTYKVTRGPHYGTDALITVFELKFYILFTAKGIMNHRQIISSRLWVRINQI